MATLVTDVKQVLRERLVELEEEKSTPNRTEKIEAVHFLIGLLEAFYPAAPKKYGKTLPTLESFSGKGEKWGNA
ncbi:MAG TPA: hypothetical protein VIE66_02690 [Methylocella sp.]|jgi:hypothetical protein